MTWEEIVESARTLEAVRRCGGAITAEMIRTGRLSLGPQMQKVIFNNPATVVVWDDDTKTVVKCGDRDVYDPEKGLALCFMKKMLGNTGRYYETVKKALAEYEKTQKGDDDGEETDTEV